MTIFHVMVFIWKVSLLIRRNTASCCIIAVTYIEKHCFSFSAAVLYRRWKYFYRHWKINVAVVADKRDFSEHHIQRGHKFVRMHILYITVIPSLPAPPPQKKGFFIFIHKWTCTQRQNSTWKWHQFFFKQTRFYEFVLF